MADAAAHGSESGDEQDDETVTALAPSRPVDPNEVVSAQRHGHGVDTLGDDTEVQVVRGTGKLFSL